MHRHAQKHRYILKDIHTCKHADILTFRDTGIQTQIQILSADSQLNIQIDKQRDKQLGLRTCMYIDRQIDRSIDRLDWTGLDCIGLHWTGLGWIGLDWFRLLKLDWIELDQVRLGQIRWIDRQTDTGRKKDIQSKKKIDT